MKAEELQNCPSCGMDLGSVKDVLPQLAFCTQCRFPLRLIAGKYRLEQRLAEGGFGEVYQARHILLRSDANRAIKVLKTEFVEQPSVQERFFREVQLTSTLSQRNEHIIRIYDDFGKDEALGYYYVMEFLQGESLAERLQKHNNLLERDQVLHLFRQLCRAMQSAHNAGIVHRDLKPDNLFIIQRENEQNFLKVLDFGIAKPTTKQELEKSSITQGVIGTPAYISPEQCQNLPIDARADLYSMGALLYKLLTGQLPFPFLPNESPDVGLLRIFRAHIVEEPLSPRQVRPDRVSQDVEDVVLKAMAKKPEQRFDSAEEMIQALEKAWSAPLAPAPKPFRRRVLASTMDGEAPAPVAEPSPKDDPSTSETMDAPVSLKTPSRPKQPTLPTPDTPSSQPVPLYSSSTEDHLDSFEVTSSKKSVLWISLVVLVGLGIFGGWVLYQRNNTIAKQPPQRTLGRVVPKRPQKHDPPKARKRKRVKPPAMRRVLTPIHVEKRAKVVDRPRPRRIRPRPRVRPVRRAAVYPTRGCPAARQGLRWIKLVIPRGPGVRVSLSGRHKKSVRRYGREFCLGLYRASRLKLKASGHKTCTLSLPFQHGIVQAVLGEEKPVDEIDVRKDNYCLKSR